MRSHNTIKLSLSHPVIGTLALLTLLAVPVSAQTVLEESDAYPGMGITERLGEQIPLDLTFINDQGDTVALEEYFHQGRPVILNLVYYNCPMLCNLILNGMTEGLKGVKWTPGQQFEIVTISFNPRETAELAAGKKKSYLNDYGRPGAEDGWTFFAGTEDQIQALADAVGFEFYWDDERQEYAHPSCIFVLTEDGTVSRYLYGISFTERDLRLALVEASEGKVGDTVDRLLLYCFHYDPDARGYVVVAGNVMKLGGAATLIILSIFLGLLWSRDRMRKSRRPAKVPARERTSA